MVSRLTYRFQPKAELEGDPTSLTDYEYLVFGGTDPENAIRSDLRRMLPFDVLGALRDAEKDLATWRRSPLRPLIERLTAALDEADRDAVETAVNAAQDAWTELDEVDAIVRTISGRLEAMVGPTHATACHPDRSRLCRGGFAPAGEKLEIRDRLCVPPKQSFEFPSTRRQPKDSLTGWIDPAYFPPQDISP